MRTAPIAPQVSSGQPGRDGFAQLLCAEWTKFKTVRAWVITAIAVAAVTAVAVIDLAVMAQNHNTPPAVATGPDGEAVTDAFYFVHQPLRGDGSITVRVTSLANVAEQMPAGATASLQPWAKAGLIVKENTTPGSQYAAVMATASHGVQMQYNFTHSVAGNPGTVSAASPPWLRLSRSGDTLAAYDSANGSSWTAIGAANLTGLPATVQAGLFVASPMAEVARGANNVTYIPTQAQATFGDLARHGSGPGPRGRVQMSARWSSSPSTAGRLQCRTTASRGPAPPSPWPARVTSPRTCPTWTRCRSASTARCSACSWSSPWARCSSRWSTGGA
jgi:hypothetical protein